MSRDDPDAALRLLEQSVPSRLRSEDAALSAEASYLRAQMLSIRGEYDAALGAIRSARLAWLTAGEQLKALRTDLGRSTVLYELGEYVGSADVCRRLLTRLARLQPGDADISELDSMHARANSNLANASARIADYPTALHHYDLARNLFAALGEPAKVAETDANLGVIHVRLGLVHQGLTELVQAQSALEAMGLRLGAAKCSTDIAEALLELNQVGAAMEELDRCGAILAELDAVPEQARVSLASSRALLQAGMAPEAREQARRAADVFTDLAMLGDAARATLISATISLSLGALEQADEEFAIAERFFAAGGEESMLAEVWFAQAQLASRRGDVPIALERAAAAVERLDRDGVLLVAGLARLMLAELTEDPDAAMDHLSRARDAARTLAIPSLHFVTSLTAARLDRRLGRPFEAARTLRSLLATADPLVRSTDEPRLRIAKERARREASDELLAILLEQGTHRCLTEAWQQATRATSEVLNVFSRMTPDAADGWSPLRPDEDRTGVWDLPMVSLVHAATTEPATPPATAPAPARRAWSPLPALPEVPLLQYHVLGTDVVAFVVSDGLVQARRLPDVVDETRLALEEWRVECQRASIHRAADEDLVDVGPILNRLHKLLVEPIGDLLDDLEGGPLLVLPHRHLHGVPFEALGGPEASLGDRFTLRFALGLAARPEAEPRPIRAGTLILAAPDERAPRIADEARLIAQVGGGVEAVVGQAATTDRFADSVGGAGVLHLACHGRFDRVRPLQSGLHLADRWLTAREILDLDLADTLVVLSACSSAESADDLGEPTGLVWALLAAGARGVIASQWTLDDEVAVEAMHALHLGLAAGMSGADALAAARRTVSAAWPHPYHSSAFRYFCSPATALTEGCPA